jgi:hypothetical protein
MFMPTKCPSESTRGPPIPNCKKKKSNAEHTTQKESPQEKYFCL